MRQRRPLYVPRLGLSTCRLLPLVVGGSGECSRIGKRAARRGVELIRGSADY